MLKDIGDFWIGDTGVPFLPQSLGFRRPRHQNFHCISEDGAQFQRFPQLRTIDTAGRHLRPLLGQSANGLALSSNLASNYNGASTFVGQITIPAGGINFSSALTLGFLPFTYETAIGDLLLEWVPSNQDLVANGQGNGYNSADYTGTNVSRAYCLTNVGCTRAVLGAGQTTFGDTTPELGTLVMLGSGSLGLAGVAHRKFMR